MDAFDLPAAVARRVRAANLRERARHSGAAWEWALYVVAFAAGVIGSAFAPGAWW